MLSQMRGPHEQEQDVIRREEREVGMSIAYTNLAGYSQGYAVMTPGGDEIRRVISRGTYRRELAAGVSTKFNGATIESYSYAYDALSRPTTRNSDTFGYNERGEVVFSHRDAENAEDAYSYDGIGNLQIAAFNFVTNTYTANNLNQYTSILRASPLLGHPLRGLASLGGYSSLCEKTTSPRSLYPKASEFRDDRRESAS